MTTIVNFPYTRCRFGVAVRDTTPPVGIYHSSWGAATRYDTTGVHRPHTVTAAVFAPLHGAGPMLALVALDLGWFQNTQDERDLRDTVIRRAGLTPETLLINLSHTHGTVNANSLLVDRPGAQFIKPFLAMLRERVGDAVRAAQQALMPAWVTWGYGTCALAKNRDYFDTEQQTWVCGFNPARKADDTLLVARVSDDAGNTRATLFNYACHPTTLAWQNHLLSPDYVGAARDVLERAFGAPALFLQGALGDVAPRDNYVGDPLVADRNGRQLGYAAAAIIEGLPPAASQFVYMGMVSSGAALGVWEYRPCHEAELQAAYVLQASLVTIELATKEYPPLTQLRATYEAATTVREKEIALRRLLVREALGAGRTHAMPLWVWRLGQAALVAIPNEPYNLVQQTLRQHFAGTPIAVLGVTNGTLGYLPPQEIYGKGIYQEQQSPYLPGCLEQTIEAAVRGVAKVMSE
jgi:hypothetical protein